MEIKMNEEKKWISHLMRSMKGQKSATPHVIGKRSFSSCLLRFELVLELRFCYESW